MRCGKVNRLLNRYIDDELDKRLTDLIEQHLQVCPNCKQELNALESIKGVVRQKERVAAEEGLLERIKDRLQPAPQVIRIKWLPEAGNLARRLIPIPMAAMTIIFTLMLTRLNGVNPVDEYIFSDLTNEEVGILSGYIDNSDLLTRVVLE